MYRMRERLDRLNDEIMPRLTCTRHDDVLATVEGLLAINQL